MFCMNAPWAVARRRFRGRRQHSEEPLQLPATLRPFDNEVVAPDVVLLPRPTPVAGVRSMAQTPPFAGFPANLRPLLLPQPALPA
jgi:hypothetical protein